MHKDPVILGFDPGKDKCGVAVVQADLFQVLEHQVVASAQVIAHLQAKIQAFDVQTLVIGNQTTSKQWQGKLRQALDPLPPLMPVDERNTSLFARDRYWQMFPPSGLQRLIPQGMRQPPRPVDDIVAILLVERYLGIENGLSV